MTEPGIIKLGEWAHVKYMERQHLVAAIRAENEKATTNFTPGEWRRNPSHPSVARPVRFVCGRDSERFRIWHDAPKPHLPECATCKRGTT